jgi:hypothetical protein
MAAGSLKTMVNTSYMSITQSVSTLFAGASAVFCNATGITNNSPKWKGINGAAAPGNFEHTQYNEPGEEIPHKTVMAPTPNPGATPAMPA